MKSEDTKPKLKVDAGRKEPPPRKPAAIGARTQLEPEQAPKRSAIDPARLKRDRPPPDLEEEPKPPKVSAGAVDKVIDLAFNPSRDKIREVTIIDRMQGRLLPQLDMIGTMWQYVIEVATYRMSSVIYKQQFKRERPIPPNPIEEFIYRTAQWQKSVAGKNLERATDIALAETETRGDEDNGIGGNEDAWKE